MELCLIAPAPHVRQTYLLPGRFCLANVIDNSRSEYQEFFSDSSDAGYEVVLDNGAFEGELVSNELYVEVAQRIRPKVLVVPDLLNADSQMNYNYALAFVADYLKELPDPKPQLMYVPQCKRDETAEYCRVIKKAIVSDQFHWLGICRNSCFNAFGKYTHTEDEAINKFFFGAWAEREGIFALAREKDVRFHLLGIGGNVGMLQHLWWVDRADTASLFFQATLDQRVSEDGILADFVSRPPDYFRRDFGPPSEWLQALGHNCHEALCYASAAARLKHKILKDRI